MWLIFMRSVGKYTIHGLFRDLVESFGLAVITASSKQPADSTLRQLPILRLIFFLAEIGGFTYKDQNFTRCLQVYFKFSNSFAGHWSMCMRMGLHHELWWKTRCFSFCIQGSLYDTNPKQCHYYNGDPSNLPYMCIITEILPIYHTCALFDFPQVIEWPLVYTGNNIKMLQTWLHQTQSIIRFQQLLRREFS